MRGSCGNCWTGARYNMHMDPLLPTDLESAHALIRQLRMQLAQTRKLLVGIMGYDPTDTQAVFGYEQSMREAMARTPSKRKPKRS